MTILLGLSTSHPNQCYKLLKSLYGLKQAKHTWYEKLSVLLLYCEYQQAQADHSLFIKSVNDEFTALIVYVDDIVLTSKSTAEMDRIKGILHSKFHIKDLRVLKYFLGLEVAYSDEGIS